MDNDKFTPQSTAEVREGHEESDLNPRAIVIFLLSLAFLGILTFIAVRVFVSDVPGVSLGWLENKLNPPTPPSPAESQLQAERSPKPPGGEAKQAEAGRAPEWYGRGGRAQMEEHLKRTFSTPRLQYDDESDMQTFRSSEDQWLASTGKDAAGNIHIPVDRAMDLLVERGLPPVSGPFVPPTLPSAAPLVPAPAAPRTR